MRIIGKRVRWGDGAGVVRGWTHQPGAPAEARWLVRVVPDREAQAAAAAGRRSRSEHHLPRSLRVEDAGQLLACPAAPDPAELPDPTEPPEL